jgi:hypothetical protein
MEVPTLGLILVATGKYDRFVEPLLRSADKHLLEGNTIAVYLLADKPNLIKTPGRIRMKQFEILHLPWPYPTLYRYKWITQYADEMTARNLFYCDVDMLFVNKVGEEIIPRNESLVAVRHPGFYVNNGWGDHATSSNSIAYLPRPIRTNYCAGGFQGGSADAYKTACREMSQNIHLDEMKGVIAHWHDESYWNHYLKGHEHIELSPEYCMVERVELRKKWGIDKLTPRLVALQKDHKQLRT